MDDYSKMFDILSNSRRRVVIAYLNEREAVKVDELVDAIVQFEDRLSPQGDDFDRVYADLHHAHLPKLAELGVVEYHCEQGVIEMDSSCYR